MSARFGPLAGLILLVLALLGGCALAVDAEQARVCRRVLPALVPAGDGRLRVLRVAPGPGPASLRLDFALETPGRTARPHAILCRFAAEGLATNKADLVGVDTEGGPVSGASLYLLKRYYLDSLEGIVGDPAPEEDRAGAAPLLVTPGAAYALQQFLAGLPRTVVTALLAAAYALVFGLTGRINLAFGEVAAVGGVAAGLGTLLALGLGLSAAVPGLALAGVVAVAAAALHNLVGGFATLRLVRPGTRGQAPLIASVGLSLALMEYLRLAQGATPVWIAPLGTVALPVAQGGDFVASVTPAALMTAGIGCLAGAGLLWTMQATAYGRAWRACADDAHAAALMGVDAVALLRRTLLLSGALAGLAGVLVVAQYGSFGFADGFGLGLKALIAAVLGGIGSVPGAFLGGLAIGLFETAWSALLPIAARDPALYAVLVVVLILRPGGLFGFAQASPRQV
jgi:branched-chain amino acid transport system permease protein